MENIIISIIHLILSFAITIFCYKKYGKYGLYIWMSVLVIICNIQTTKISEIFGLTISLGNISYGALFLTTDILTEKYGKNSTYNATKISFMTMAIFALLMYIFLQYKPSKIDFSQDALVTIFSYVPRVTAGSLLAYYISQRCDAFLYSKLKAKYNKVWISNNVSTMVSQIVDTLIFVMIAFVGTIPSSAIITMILCQYIWKVVYEVVATPITYKVINWYKKLENY